MSAQSKKEAKAAAKKAHDTRSISLIKDCFHKLQNARSLDDVTLALNRLGNCKTVSIAVLEETSAIEEVGKHQKKLEKRQEIMLVNLCKDMVNDWKKIIMEGEGKEGEEEDDDTPEWRTKLDKIKERKEDSHGRLDWYDRDLALETSSMIADEKLLDRSHMLPPIGGRRSSAEFDPFFAQIVHEIEHDYLKTCWYQKENKYLAIAKAKDAAKLVMPGSDQTEEKAEKDKEKGEVAKERAKRKAAREAEKKRKEAERIRLEEEARVQAEKDKRMHEQLLERKRISGLYFLGMANDLELQQEEALQEYRRKFNPRPLTRQPRPKEDKAAEEDEEAVSEEGEVAVEVEGEETVEAKTVGGPGVTRVKRAVPCFKSSCPYDAAKGGSCKFGTGCKFLHPSRWVLGSDAAAEEADFCAGDQVLAEVAGLPPPGQDSDDDSEDDG
jgi:hypothetical protein